jgi:hypothetical protein
MESIWHGVTASTDILINGKRFRLSTVEPTREGSDFAWLTGRYITNGGRTTKGMISHLHCPEGERQEFVNIDSVRIFV